MKNLMFIISILLTFAASTCFAQHDNWKNYSSSFYVYALLPMGDHLYVGTDGGLLRVNLLTDSIEVFNVANSPLTDISIINLAADTGEGIWMVTRSKDVIFFNGKDEWEVIHCMSTGVLACGIPSGSLLDIDRNGTKWIGNGPFINSYNGTHWKRYRIELFDPEQYLNSISADTGDHVWAGTDCCGIARLNKKNDSIRMFSPSEITGQPVQGWRSFHVRADREGNVWATSHGSIYKYDGTAWNEMLSSGTWGDIFIDGNGNKWFYEGDKLLRLSSDTSYTRVHLHGYTFNWPYPPFTVDSHDSIWLGHGLRKLRDSAWYYLEMPRYTFGNSLRCAATYGDTIFVGTSGHLSMFDGSDWKIISNTNVTGIEIDSTGTAWIGTYHNGAVKYRDGMFESVPGTADSRVNKIRKSGNGNILISTNKKGIILTKDSIRTFTDQSVTDAREDSEGVIWYLRGSLNRHATDSITSYPVPSGFGAGVALAIDQDNNKWVATSSGKVLVFTDTTWKVMDMDKYPKFIFGSIYAIETDKRGNIWVGGGSYDFWNLDSALLKFNGQEWKPFTRYNSGLPVNHVTDIHVDEGNNLWISTAGGGLAFMAADTASIIDTTTGNSQFNTFNNFVTVNIYPNPATAHVVLDFTLQKPEKVNLILFDLVGKKISQPVHDLDFSEGKHSHGIAVEGLPAGAYIYILTIGRQFHTGKLILSQ